MLWGCAGKGGRLPGGGRVQPERVRLRLATQREGQEVGGAPLASLIPHHPWWMVGGRRASSLVRPRAGSLTPAVCAGCSYVCDVNGWSFVKNSRRFYDDTAGILRNILLGGEAGAVGML